MGPVFSRLARKKKPVFREKPEGFYGNKNKNNNNMDLYIFKTESSMEVK